MLGYSRSRWSRKSITVSQGQPRCVKCKKLTEGLKDRFVQVDLLGEPSVDDCQIDGSGKANNQTEGVLGGTARTIFDDVKINNGIELFFVFVHGPVAVSLKWCHNI